MIVSTGLSSPNWILLPMALIPLIGGLISKLAPTVLPAITRFFGGGAAPKVAPAIVRAIPSAITRLAPTVRRALPVLRRGGAIAGAGAAFEAGSRLVGGQRGITVRIGRDGQPVMVRRRRINPGNVRAARRAIRRLRAFARVTRKVNRLLSPKRVFVRAPGRFRRRTRGDILPFEHDGSINPYAAEDWADYADELEDLGYDPRSFFQEDEVAE